ncbi:MAG: Dps family protein [Candidatus Algichlamydia australiensis]|nr:Dps family protein [Chlamydiales bacterium]
MDIGLKKEDCKTICTILNTTLATTYAIYLKTQFFHWNVTGKEFYALHVLFQKQYEEMAEAIDEVAERVRALGEYPPGSFSSFAKLSQIQEESLAPSSDKMLQILTTDHQTLICYLRKHLSQIEDLQDGATADLINKRLAIHEKAAWMLRSSI